MKILVAILALFKIFRLIQGLEKQITVNVAPGKQDCFFERIKEKENVEVDYQVIDGAHSDLDVTFQVFDPNGRILVADFKKTGNTHTFTTHLDGDHKFCFDNTFSTFATKTVFFELIIDNEDDEDDPENMHDLNAEDIYELKVHDILEIINRVKSDINKVRQLQDIIKSVEARDRNIAEENHSTVNLFSFVQISIMIIVGFVQVVMVRSLFDEKSRVHKFWKTVDARK